MTFDYQVLFYIIIKIQSNRVYPIGLFWSIINGFLNQGLVLLEWKYFPTPKILDPERLSNLIKTYRSCGEPMDIAIATLRKNLRGVLNASQTKLSNGPLEGINRKIKALKRSCYGFANQERMFERIYQLIAQKSQCTTPRGGVCPKTVLQSIIAAI